MYRQWNVVIKLGLWSVMGSPYVKWHRILLFGKLWTPFCHRDVWDTQFFTNRHIMKDHIIDFFTLEHTQLPDWAKGPDYRDRPTRTIRLSSVMFVIVVMIAIIYVWFLFRVL